jgi:hypothetical protein
MSTPTPDPDRDRRRREKLATKPTAEERQERIREHEEKGREESDTLAQEQVDRITQAPKPAPYERIGETTGKSPAQILIEHGQDVDEAISRGEGEEPTPETAPVAAPAKRLPLKERNRPKQ